MVLQEVNRPNYLIGLCKEAEEVIGGVVISLADHKPFIVTTQKEMQTCFNVRTEYTTSKERTKMLNTQLYIGESNAVDQDFSKMFLIDGDIANLPVYNKDLQIIANNKLVIIHEEEQGYGVIDTKFNVMGVRFEDITAWSKKYSFYNYNSLLCKQGIFKLYPVFTQTDVEFDKFKQHMTDVVARATLLGAEVEVLLPSLFTAVAKCVKQFNRQDFDVQFYSNKRVDVRKANTVNFFFEVPDRYEEQYHLMVQTPKVCYYRSMLFEYELGGNFYGFEAHLAKCSRLARIECIPSTAITLRTAFFNPDASRDAALLINRQDTQSWRLTGGDLVYLFTNSPQQFFLENGYYDYDWLGGICFREAHQDKMYSDVTEFNVTNNIEDVLT